MFIGFLVALTLTSLVLTWLIKGIVDDNKNDRL